MVGYDRKTSIAKNGPFWILSSSRYKSGSVFSFEGSSAGSRMAWNQEMLDALTQCGSNVPWFPVRTLIILIFLKFVTFFENCNWLFSVNYHLCGLWLITHCALYQNPLAQKWPNGLYQRKRYKFYDSYYIMINLFDSFKSFFLDFGHINCPPPPYAWLT